MSNLDISADDLLELYNNSNVSNDVKLDYMQKLKTHIKKDTVDLDQVPTYLQVIIKGLDLTNPNIQSVSFNSLAYLIKRISVQDRSGNILKNQSFLMLPILINRLGAFSNLSLTKKALEDYWLNTPNDVEEALKEISFNNVNVRITIESIKWIHQLFTNISKKVNIHSFMPLILSSINMQQNNRELIEVTKDLTKEYYSVYPNLIDDLRTQINQHNITRAIEQEILQFEKPTNDVKAVENLKQSETDTNDELTNDLHDLLERVHCTISTGVDPIDFDRPEALYHMFDSFLPCFENKETETNWKMREKNVIKIRSIIRGNSSDKYTSTLIACLKNLAPGISKGAQSLRTTLCGHSCQLLKECAMVLKDEIEPVAETVLANLIKLCSSTKSITSTNANMAVCAFYANLPYNQKLLQKISTTVEEKNYQPRSYAGWWLQIILLRYGIDSTLLNGHESYLIDSSNKVLIKLLKDANPKARQIAKDCYFCYTKVFPVEAEKLMKKLDLNTIKALERSQKSSAQTTRPSSQNRTSRPSIKEAIIERNKELKQQRPPSRSGADSKPMPLPKVSKTTVSKPISRFEKFNKTSTRASSWTSQVSTPVHTPTNQTKRVRSSTDFKISPIDSKPTSTKSTPKRMSTSSFDNHNDPMINFLVSNDTVLIKEGIGLLKFAIIGKEKLPDSFQNIMKKIADTHPTLLKPLFTNSDFLFHNASQLFTTNDLLRICCLMFSNMDEKTFDKIMLCMEPHQFFQSSTYILSCIVDVPDILGSQEHVLSISNNKFEIGEGVLKALSLSLNKLAITAVQYDELLNELIRSIALLKASNCYNSLTQVICQLYTIDSGKFMSILQDVDVTLKEEVENIVGIDSTMRIRRPLSKSVFDLTEVIRPNVNLKVSPNPIDTDFTMIMPKKSDFMKPDIGQRPLKLAKAPPTIDPATEVEVKNHNIQEFIEKVDPLRNIASGMQKITIYEDQATSLNEGIVKNWKNFQYARLSSKESDLNSTFNIATFETDCKRLTLKPVADDNIILNIITLIESMSSANYEYREYFLTKGRNLIEESLWEYFNKSNLLNNQQIINGLFLLKVLLRFNCDSMNVNKIWVLLKETCINEPVDSEMYFVWREILSNYKLNYDLQDTILDYLETSNLNLTISTLCLNYLSKCLIEDNSLDFKKIYRLDDLFGKLFTNKEVIFRRNSTICYSSLMKNTSLSSEVKDVLHKVKSRYSLSQQRLIEFYTHR